MSETGRKRCRKAKLVPRDFSDFNDDCILQEPPIKKKLLDKIKKEPADYVGLKQESSLQFSVKVEVEDIQDTLPDEDPSNYMKFLFSLSKESHSDVDSDILGSPDPESYCNKLDIDQEDDKAITLDVDKMQKLLPLLHRTYPLEKESVMYTRNLWGKVFHEKLMNEWDRSAQDILLLEVLGEWKTWQIGSRIRQTPFCYKCYICTDAWWSFSDFRNHIKIHPDAYIKFEIEPSLHECNIVASEVETPPIKEIYVDGKCLKCAKTFQYHRDCKRFVDYYYYCVHCQDKFQTCRSLARHLGTCDKNPIRTSSVLKDIMANRSTFTEFGCKVCNIVSLTKPAHMEHVSVCHTVRSDEPIGTTYKICRLCERPYYMFHYHVCPKKNIIHACKYCHSKFQNKQMLECHMKMWNKPVECNFCDKHIVKPCMAAEHYVTHSKNFHMVYRCLPCKRVKLFLSDDAMRNHRSKSHRKADYRRPGWDKIVVPKIMLEQCLLNSNARQKKKVRPSLPVKAGVKAIEKTKEKSIREARKSIAEESNKTNDISLVSKETENVTKTTEHKNMENITDLLKISDQITECIDIKPDIIKIKEEKQSDEEDAEPDIISNIFEGTISSPGEIKAESEAPKVSQTSATTTEEVPTDKKLSNVFQVSQNILEPKTVVKQEIKEEPEESDDDLIIIGCSNESIKQEVKSENSDMSILNLQPDVILKAGYRKRKVYKCNRCDYEGFHREYREHMNSHCMKVSSPKKASQTELNFKCTKCNRGYPCLKRYAQHFVEHDYKFMTCPQCVTVFDSITRLMSHMNLHIKNQFVRIQQIHDNDESNKKAYQCKTCKEVVDMKTSFVHWEAHLDIMAEPDQQKSIVEPAKVGPRGEYALDPEDLHRVLALLQNPDTAESLGLPRKVKACFLCLRNFERQNDCKRHLIEHLLENAYANTVDTELLRCQICKESFMKPDRYKKHMRDHASLPIYQCALCDKTFSDSSNFTKHKKIHNLKAFLCDICNKKFQAKLSLEKHMEMHMVTDPFTCERCNRVFHDRSFFKRHVRQHHDKLPSRFKCQICRDKFPSLREKWDHMWTVHKQRKEKADCPICKRSYRKYSDVKKHCQMEHGVQMSLANVCDLMNKFKSECESGTAAKPDCDDKNHDDSSKGDGDVDSDDDDVLLIEEERETLVIYDDDVPIQSVES